MPAEPSGSTNCQANHADLSVVTGVIATGSDTCSQTDVVGEEEIFGESRRTIKRILLHCEKAGEIGFVDYLSHR